MDLFDYAQELFNEQGELWLPAMGHFFKVRKSSYYDYEAGFLHPPRLQTGFEEKSDNTDSSLITYFAKSKNLSQGSAKYFVDKFVENLKDQLQQREVNFGLLGTLYLDASGRIALKGTALPNTDGSALYGLAPIKIEKIGSANSNSGLVAEDNIVPPASENSPSTNHNTDNSFANADDTNSKETIESGHNVETGDAQVIETPPARPTGPIDFYADDRVLVMKGKVRQEESSNRFQFWILAAIVALAVIGIIYMITQSYLNPIDKTGDVSGQILSHGGRTDTVINVSKAKADSALVHTNDLKDLPAALDTSGVDHTMALPIPSTTKSPAAEPNNTPSTEIPKGSWLVSGGQNNNYDAALNLK